ncbi:MAG TPA: hypothetical protein VF713_19790 [Thermoanaerobaculia bacterium]
MAVTGDNAAPLFLLETFIDSYASTDESVIDLHVLEALEATRRLFAAEAQGRTFQPRLGDERVRELFAGLCGASELLLGRAPDDIDHRAMESSESIRIDSLVRCLKQLEKSVKLWTEQGGRKGYLLYIRQFLPRA